MSGETTIYGYHISVDDRDVLEEIELTARGLPRKTGKRRPLNLEHARPILFWKGIVGVAETSYPHPKGWSLTAGNSRYTLNQLTVRSLTHAFRDAHTTPPTCMNTWPQKLGIDIHWPMVMRKLKNKLLTPKDCKNWFRILHRSFYARTHDPTLAQTHGTKCRLNCGCGLDSLSHLKDCPMIHSFFAPLEDPPSPQLIYLGLRRTGAPLGPMDEVIYILMWREVYFRFAKLGIDDQIVEDYTKFTASILKGVFRRIAILLEAHTRSLQNECNRHTAQGNQEIEHICARYSRDIAPSAGFDPGGNLMLSKSLADMLIEFGGYTKAFKPLPDSTGPLESSFAPPPQLCAPCAH